MLSSLCNAERQVIKLETFDFSSFLGDSPSVSPEEANKRCELNKVDSYNSIAVPDDGTGVICEECKGKRQVAFICEATGLATYRYCSCYKQWVTAKRLIQSGMQERVKRCNLATFFADTPTHRFMKETAEAYLQQDRPMWFAVCGQSGAGKTHLCTAVFCALLEKLDKDGNCLQWIRDSRLLKAKMLDCDAAEWQQFKTCGILYMDDICKCSQLSSSDIKILFEILDYRYNNQLPTIISTELPFDKLYQADTAIAGRIKEMCGAFLIDISPDPQKNYRFSS